MCELRLKCDKFGLSRGLHELLTSGELVDVTLACQGQFIQAHKTVLAACSPHFRDIFKVQAWQHPIVFMHDLEVSQLQALVNFMYNGEVTVNEGDLPGFLKLADSLKVSGLASQEKEAGSGSRDASTLPRPPATQPPAKIARRLRDVDVSTHGSSPVAGVTSQQSGVEENVPTSWQSAGEVNMLTSDIKLEVEEVTDLTQLQPEQASMQECEEEEEEEEEEEDSHAGVGSAQEDCEEEDEDVGVGSPQEDGTWYDAGPSTSNQSSSQPNTHQAVSSRGHPVDEITLSDSGDEQQNEVPPQMHITSSTIQHQQQTPAKLPCKICDKRFCNLHYLRRHIVEKHDKNMDSKNKCIVCFEEFDTPLSTSLHLKHQHPEYRFDCKACARSFSSHQHLMSHVFKAHGDKSNMFQCSDCNNMFSTQSRLSDHFMKYHAM